MNYTNFTLTNKARAATAFAALVACVAPAAANATSVAYRDGSNVFLANADGSNKRQITTDGVSTDYYTYPSVADDGTVVSIKGYNTTRAIAVHSPAGQLQALNVMPWKISSGINIGPTYARVSPSGGQLVYGYLLNHGPYSGGIQQRMAIVTPRTPGLPTNPSVDIASKTDASWMGSKLVAMDNGLVGVETDPLQFQSILQATNGDTLQSAEVARNGSRALVLHKSGEMTLVSYSGALIDGPDSGCSITANGADRYVSSARIAMSADGSKVAWSDQSGVHVATVPSVPNDQACPLTNQVLLSATAGMPAFSEYTVPGSGSTGVGGAPDPIVSSKVSASKLATAGGAAVTVKVPGAGKVKGGVYLAKKKIGTATGTAKKAGNVKIKVKLSKKARKSISKYKGQTLTLKLTFTPKKGKKVKLSGTIKLS